MAPARQRFARRLFRRLDVISGSWVFSWVSNDYPMRACASFTKVSAGRLPKISAPVSLKGWWAKRPSSAPTSSARRWTAATCASRRSIGPAEDGWCQAILPDGQINSVCQKSCQALLKSKSSGQGCGAGDRVWRFSGHGNVSLKGGQDDWSLLLAAPLRPASCHLATHHMAVNTLGSRHKIQKRSSPSIGREEAEQLRGQRVLPWRRGRGSVWLNRPNLTTSWSPDAGESIVCHVGERARYR